MTGRRQQIVQKSAVHAQCQQRDKFEVPLQTQRILLAILSRYFWLLFPG